MAEINKNFRVKNGLEVGGDGAFEGTVTADSFQLDTTYVTGSVAPGELAWNPDAGTIEFELKDGNIVHRIGQQEVIRVENNTGSTIAQGSVVYISGASGFLPRVSLADASTEATSSKTFGLVASDGGIATGAEGFVVTSGLVRGVNTDGITAGTALWLSTTAGQYTATKPTAPDHGVFIGWVVKSGTNGEILTKIQNGYELNELHSVLIDGTPADNEVLAYDSTSGLWKNQTAAEAGLATSGHTHALDDLSDVTITTPSSGQVLKYNGSAWINDTDAGGGGDSFGTIAVSGQSNVVADSSSDTLTLVAGSNVTITTDAASDSITIAATDTNTTYSVSAETVSGGANLRLTGSDATTDDVKIQGSGVTAVTRTDANTITVGPDYSLDYETTTATTSTKTLTATSPRNQFITGAAQQPIRLPDTSTLKVGDWFVVINAMSSNILTVSTSTGTTILSTVNASAIYKFTCISTANNTTSAWYYSYEGTNQLTQNGSGAIVHGLSPSISTPTLTLSTTTSSSVGRLARTAGTLRLGDGSTTLTFTDDSGTATLTNKTLGSGTALGASLNANSNKITSLGTPTADTDAATKAYVDAATAGLNVHASVRAATTVAGGNINLSTGLVSGTVLDGITLATGNRVLVKNQSTASENGVYIVPASGAASRATDYDSTPEVDAGDFIFVESGTVNGKTGWVQVNAITTIGSDNIEFVQFSGAGTYTAGTGLTLTGNQFSVTANTYQPLDADLTAIAELSSTGWLQRTGTDTWSLGTPPDTNTTYSISAETVTGGANLRLTGSDASTDDVKIAGSGATTVTRTDANTITVSSTDNNTTYDLATSGTSTATISLTGSDSTTDSFTITGSGATTVSHSGGAITISSTDTNTVTNAFSTIATTSGTSPVASSTSDTLTLTAGTGISVTGNSSTDTVTFANTGVTSVNGSTGAVTSIATNNRATVMAMIF